MEIEASFDELFTTVNKIPWNSPAKLVIKDDFNITSKKQCHILKLESSSPCPTQYNVESL